MLIVLYIFHLSLQPVLGWLYPEVEQLGLHQCAFVLSGFQLCSDNDVCRLDISGVTEHEIRIFIPCPPPSPASFVGNHHGLAVAQGHNSCQAQPFLSGFLFPLSFLSFVGPSVLGVVMGSLHIIVLTPLLTSPQIAQLECAIYFLPGPPQYSTDAMMQRQRRWDLATY